MTTPILSPADQLRVKDQAIRVALEHLEGRRKWGSRSVVMARLREALAGRETVVRD